MDSFTLILCRSLPSAHLSLLCFSEWPGYPLTSQDRFADPDERLAHYRSNAVEKDEEIVIEERSNLFSTIKANIEKAQDKLYDAKHGAGISFQVGSFVIH